MTMSPLIEATGAADDRRLHVRRGAVTDLWPRHRRLATDQLERGHAGADARNSDHEAALRLKRRIYLSQFH